MFSCDIPRTYVNANQHTKHAISHDNNLYEYITYRTLILEYTF